MSEGLEASKDACRGDQVGKASQGTGKQGTCQQENDRAGRAREETGRKASRMREDDWALGREQYMVGEDSILAYLRH